MAYVYHTSFKCERSWISSPALGWGVEGESGLWTLISVSSCVSFQLTVEMFDYLECELNLFQTGKSPSLLAEPGCHGNQSPDSQPGSA